MLACLLAIEHRALSLQQLGVSDTTALRTVDKSTMWRFVLVPAQGVIQTWRYVVYTVLYVFLSSNRLVL